MLMNGTIVEVYRKVLINNKKFRYGNQEKQTRRFRI